MAKQVVDGTCWRRRAGHTGFDRFRHRGGKMYCVAADGSELRTVHRVDEAVSFEDAGSWVRVPDKSEVPVDAGSE